MDTLTFIATLLEHGAWPATALGIVYLLRVQLRDLLPSIKRLEAGPVKVELERVAKELEMTKQVAAAADAKATEVATKFEDNEIAHRVAYIQSNLSRNPMTVGDAYEALYATLGGGGAFRVTSREYTDISLSALALRANRPDIEVDRLRALEQSLRRVPGGSSTNPVDEALAKEIRKDFASLHPVPSGAGSGEV